MHSATGARNFDDSEEHADIITMPNALVKRIISNFPVESRGINSMDYHYAFREKALSAPRNPEKTMGRPQDPPAELSNMG